MAKALWVRIDEMREELSRALPCTDACHLGERGRKDCDACAAVKKIDEVGRYIWKIENNKGGRK